MWCGLQNNIIKLSKIYDLGEPLKEFDIEILVPKKVLNLILGPNKTLTDAERLEITTGQVIEVPNPNIKILFPSEVKDFDKIPLQVLFTRLNTDPHFEI